MQELDQAMALLAKRRAEVNLHANLDLAGRSAAVDAKFHYDGIKRIAALLSDAIDDFYKALGEVEAAGLRAATAICATCGDKATRYGGPQRDTPKCEACYWGKK